LTLLVDSTVWIDYFNGVITAKTEYLDSAVGSELILVGDLILAEVLQGFRLQKDFVAARDRLVKFPLVNIVGSSIALKSAENYRQLRSQGITVRKTIDCLIATYCIENNLMLLHSDRDFDHFAAHLGLPVWHE